MWHFKLAAQLHFTPKICYITSVISCCSSMSAKQRVSEGWNVIPCSAKDLQLKVNLTCGQSFRWRCLKDGSIIGVFSHRVWLLQQKPKVIQYKVLACQHGPFDNSQDVARKSKKSSAIKQENRLTRATCGCEQNEQAILTDYLRLNEDLCKLYSEWTKKDKKFSVVGKKCPGIRLLQQEPTETLLSFLCSVNNAIYRIVPMVERMCQTYGKQLLEFNGVTFYDFPTLEALCSAKNLEQNLRQIGFGYRAPFIEQCAKMVHSKGGERWMNSLRKESYEKSFNQLLDLPGVGMKVADCVCLMSLDKFQAVPVDTHIRQIAVRDYCYKMTTKTLSPKSYRHLGDFFRSLWGSYAGWAQAVAFVADLKELPAVYELAGEGIPAVKKVRKET